MRHRLRLRSTKVELLLRLLRLLGRGRCGGRGKVAEKVYFGRSGCRRC